MWNHRVLVKEYSDEDGKQFEFGIYEVYYDDDGVPNMCTEDPVAVVGESLAGLGQTLDWMRKCLLQPLLAYADFEEDGKYWTENPFDISWNDYFNDPDCPETDILEGKDEQT